MRGNVQAIGAPDHSFVTSTSTMHIRSTSWGHGCWVKAVHMPNESDQILKGPRGKDGCDATLLIRSGDNDDDSFVRLW